MKEIDTMIITGDDGVEQEVRVLFTFEDNNKRYAVFEFSDTGEVSAVIYHPDKNDSEGTIEYIETDAEWDLVEKVLEQYERDLENLDEEDMDE